jgi:histidinol-phosphate aminotransferase
MSWLTSLARPEIQALQAYEHASWEPGFVRLHANESPWRIDGDPSVEGLNRYPEPHPHVLADKLADYYSVPHGFVLPGRGSDEAIDLLVRSYCRAGIDSVLIVPPTFGMYGVAARIQGAKVLAVPTSATQGFQPDFTAIRRAVDATVRLVFLCSPNNPTGNLLSANELLKLARDLADRALLVVDEAYIEFSGRDSLAGSVETVPGLVVLRTLSKAHALAGARCGALIAQPEIVQLLQRVIQPYAVTQLSIEAAFLALSPANLMRTSERVNKLIAERERVASALGVIPAVSRVWPSAANFLLVQFGDARKAKQLMHAAGLLVRDFSRSTELTGTLRITLGTPEQNDRLLASLI